MVCGRNVTRTRGGEPTMSWLDLNGYVTIENAARERLDELFKHDSPRRIDETIDYFGETAPMPSSRSCNFHSRARAWHPACVLEGPEM
jgi:hypothetical protein